MVTGAAGQLDSTPDRCPLVIDLDGTLIRSDLLIETALGAARQSPWQVVKMFGWLRQGKPVLKRALAEQTEFEPQFLPYNPAVIELIENARMNGRQVVLATASDRLLADQVAAHLGLFDDVLATENGVNLSAARKRDALVARYGEQGFDYVGNSRDDLIVWRSARQAIAVDPDFALQARASAQGNLQQVIASEDSHLRTWLRALRVHQWTKNLLIFVPLLASHQAGDPVKLLTGILAFICFSLCASSVYLLNDLLDLEDDRHHPTKRHRPFAAGTLSLKAGLLVTPVLLISAFAIALLTLPWQFSAILGVYYLLTLTYSLSLKRIMMVDVITLALLYTIRIVGGTFALDIPPTFWMLTFSLFLFQSLALVKRYAELREARRKGDTGKSRGRGYFAADLDMIASLGSASGYLAVLILALYVHDDRTVTLYRNPEIIWLTCPLLLFWMSRIWMLTHRGQMHDDPVVFAIRDRTSIFVGLLFGLIFLAAR